MFRLDYRRGSLTMDQQGSNTMAIKRLPQDNTDTHEPGRNPLMVKHGLVGEYAKVRKSQEIVRKGTKEWLGDCG